jgi:hypothetical protein
MIFERTRIVILTKVKLPPDVVVHLYPRVGNCFELGKKRNLKE